MVMLRRAVIAAALVLLSGCGPDAAPRVLVVPKPIDWVATGQPDRLVGGPQGGEGQFAVRCDLTHLAPDDPIVHAGHPGFSHLHQFFGAVGVDAYTTLDDLHQAETTCNQSLDRAAYWSPTLVDAAGETVVADRIVAYYRAGPEVDPTSVDPFPPGLMMVAGNADATVTQPIELVSWSCGPSLDRSTLPMDCAESGTLRLNVMFPDCWNGSLISAIPGQLHVAYSSGGRCPQGFGVPIPQLHLAIEFPAVDPEGLSLSSGDIRTAHADFWNGWDPDKFEREVRHCINRDLACSVIN